jgi:hypothetical protein
MPALPSLVIGVCSVRTFQFSRSAKNFLDIIPSHPVNKYTGKTGVINGTFPFSPLSVRYVPYDKKRAPRSVVPPLSCGDAEFFFEHANQRLKVNAI